MKSIVLHAGLPKTGTSAVQAWLAAHVEQLADVGVWYPWHPVDENQISAGNAGNLMSNLKGPWLKDEDCIADTLRAAEATGCETLLLSSEAFLPELPALAETLPAETRFVLYVRDPLEFLESDYNQRVKRMRHTETFVPEPDEYGGWLGHEWLYKALESDTLRPRLELRPYHPKLFAGGSLLTDLLSAVGIDVGRLGDLSLARINTSYSLHALEIKRALNALPLGPAVDERLDLRLQACPLGPDRYTLIHPSDQQRLRRLADEELQALALRYDIDALEPLRRTILAQPPKPYHPQRLTPAEVEAVAEHLGRRAIRLTGRLANALDQHPEVELPYPSLRAAIKRAEAGSRRPAAPLPPPRRWWQRLSR